jgi:hypothetical protein
LNTCGGQPPPAEAATHIPIARQEINCSRVLPAVAGVEQDVPLYLEELDPDIATQNAGLGHETDETAVVVPASVNGVDHFPDW